jgi:hypothetical protein
LMRRLPTRTVSIPSLVDSISPLTACVFQVDGVGGRVAPAAAHSAARMTYLPMVGAPFHCAGNHRKQVLLARLGQAPSRSTL